MFLKDSFSVSVDTTTEGKQSIEMIKNIKTKYDIIFMDVNMPVINNSISFICLSIFFFSFFQGMDGIQVIKKLNSLEKSKIIPK